jgi:hypothetical protein
MIEEAEKAAQNGRMKTVYEVTRTLCNEKRRESKLVKDKDGNPLSKKEDCKKRWKEHFETILNRPNPTNPVNITENDTVAEEFDIDTEPIKETVI